MAIATGTACAKCANGWYVVTSSHRRRRHQVRYFACWRCGHRPAGNKQAVPLEAVTRRRRRAA